MHQLCNAIQATAIFYLFDSQSCTLFNPNLFLPLYVPIIVLSLDGLSACFPCVCSAEILQQGVTKLGKVSGKMEICQTSDQR